MMHGPIHVKFVITTLNFFYCCYLKFVALLSLRCLIINLKIFKQILKEKVVDFMPQIFLDYRLLKLYISCRVDRINSIAQLVISH